MFIVAIGWIYVVLMMAITETTPVAGVMTFILYGLVPVAMLLYLSGGRQRKRRRIAEQQERKRQPAEVERVADEQAPPSP